MHIRFLVVDFFPPWLFFFFLWVISLSGHMQLPWGTSQSLWRWHPTLTIDRTLSRTLGLATFLTVYKCPALSTYRTEAVFQSIGTQGNASHKPCRQGCLPWVSFLSGTSSPCSQSSHGIRAVCLSSTKGPGKDWMVSTQEICANWIICMKPMRWEKVCNGFPWVCME